MGLLSRAAIATTLALSLASCSGESDAPSASDARSASDGATGIGAKWSECMRAAGFDVPDADDSAVESGVFHAPAGVGQGDFGQAAEACAEKLGVSGASSADKQKWARQYAQVADCVRENGYPDFPPQPAGSITFSESKYPRAAEEQFKKVSMDCLQKYAPDTQMQNPG